MSIYVTDENGNKHLLSGGNVSSENESNISNEAAEYYENLYDAAKDNLITHYKDECIISNRQTIGVFTKRSPHEFATDILTSILDLRRISGTTPTPIYYNTDMFELVDGIVAEYDMVFYGLEKNTKYTVSFSTFLNWTDTTMFGVHVPVDDTSEHVVEFVTDNRGAYTFERGFKMSPVDAYSVHAYQFGMLCLVKGDYSGTARQFGDVVTAVELNSITYDTFKRSKKYTDDTSKNKVDVVEGKSLSTNDYTNEDKNKLAEINMQSIDFAESERQKSKNLWAYGDVSGTKGKDIILKQPLPIGTYTMSYVAESADTDSSKCLIEFYDENGKYISGNNVERNKRENILKKFTVPVGRISFYASTSFAGGTNDTFTFSNIQIEEGEVATDYQPYNGAIVHEKEAERYELVYDKEIRQTPLGGTLAYTTGIYGTVEMDLSKYRFIRIYYGHNNKQYTMIINCDIGCNGSSMQLAEDTNILATLVECTKTSFTLVKNGYYNVPSMTFTDRTGDVSGYYSVYRIEGVY